jgi:biotin carboxyl carrier protein
MTTATKEFTITLDGVEYPVITEGASLANDNKIVVNGRPFSVEVTEDGTVLVDGIAYNVKLKGETATLGEESYPLEVTGLRSQAITGGATKTAAAPVTEAGAVLAIMPGQIVRVLVEPGQQVEEGEPACVLEAMKMENELHAGQSGTVKAVHVKAGDDVEKDQVLIEIG